MKTRPKLITFSNSHPVSMLCTAAVTVLLGTLSGVAQTVKYLYSGSEETVTLNPGTYDISAYGAQGGAFTGGGGAKGGGLGAEMVGEFTFTTSTNLTLLVGGAGINNPEFGAGGGGGSYVVNGGNIFYVGQVDYPFVIAGAGGGGGYVYGGGNGLTSTSAANGTGGFNYGGGGGSNGGGGGGGGYDNTVNGLGSGAGGNGGNGGSGYEGGGGGGGFTGSGGSAGNAGGGAGYESGGTPGGGSGSGFGSDGGFGGGGAASQGGGGGGGGYSGGGGGEGGNDPGGGGGGGSYIAPFAVADVTEVSGVASPDDAPNGEIIITAVAVPPQSAPPLLISHSGTNVMVRWQNVFGWTLQQNTNLASPGSWIPSVGIASANDTNSLSIPAPIGNLFFRLSN